jgi:hypothetical protein
LLRHYKNSRLSLGGERPYARHTIVTIAKRDFPIASNATGCHFKATIIPCAAAGLRSLAPLMKKA